MTDARSIEEAAARWLIRREEPDWDAGDEAQFSAWLNESLANKAALWRLEHGWRIADRIGALGSREAGATGARRRWTIPAAAVGLAASVLAVVGWTIFPPAPKQQPVASFQTQLGGRRVIALTDGSRIELNTATSVRTEISATRREVWLDRGEAYFEVKHIDGRTFVVHAGPRTVTVVGTKFSVRRDGETVRVSVIEGRVRIADSSRGDAAPSSIVTRGDVAIAQGASTLISTEPVDRVEDGLAWRDGMLTFDRISLADAATEFNRYNRRRLVIADPSISSIRIGGTFRASNVDAFARLLEQAYGLKMTMSEDEIVIAG